MNRWLEMSIEYANQRSYLDDLFTVYPTIPEGIRDIDETKWGKVEKSFKSKNKTELIKSLLDLELFPVKDSYIAYLKRDKNSIERNPKTISRIYSRIIELGLDEVYKRCSEPKETNRQIGPMFKKWISERDIGIPVLNIREFSSSTADAILSASDAEMKSFASRSLNYNHDKGLDFIGRVKNEYYIGEAKFLTDFGGHQNAQFADAISTLTASSRATHIAILDGVLYIKGKNKMYKKITSQELSARNIMSALVLREFLFSR